MCFYKVVNVMKFKKVILCSTFLVGINSMEVQANDFVDWTPIFKSLENACSYSKPLENIQKSLMKFDARKDSFEISPNAKIGSYKGIDAKYQRVMRPAFSDLKWERKNYRIPLVKSKLYGLEISELSFYECDGGCGIKGMDITFKPMSFSNYKKLKNRNYFTEPYGADEIGVQISDFEQGEKIYFTCDASN